MSDVEPLATQVHPVTAALAALHRRFAEAKTDLTCDYDPEWASPCELGQPFLAPEDADSERWIGWQPVARTEPGSALSPATLPADFAGLENALETPVHPDFKAYFSSFWSGTLECTAPEGHVSLLQLWNPQDADRLVENMIGHVLGQRRARAPLTLFVACTEPDSDLILSIENATGAVLLERPGSKPLRTAAPSMAALLATLIPATA
ncbi:MAG: SecY-interacting protein Syd [Pseudomonadales bacterium]